MDGKLKIVVPTDFGKKSEMALDYALTYSQNFNADVYVFHAFEHKTANFRELDKLNEEYMDRMKQAVRQAIERTYSLGVRHSIEDVHRRISHGKAYLEILRLAAGISADMIIMGSPSQKQFKELMLKAPCTLVLVREKDPEFVI